MQFKNLKWGIYLPARHRGATYYKSLRGNFYLFTSTLSFILYPLSFILHTSTSTTNPSKFRTLKTVPSSKSRYWPLIPFKVP